VLSYFKSRRLINAEEFSLILLLRAYYNSIRKEMPDKNKPYIIEALLLSLHYKSFIYHIRVSEKEDKSNIISIIYSYCI
jgi:hypothetical protein